MPPRPHPLAVLALLALLAPATALADEPVPTYLEPPEGAPPEPLPPPPPLASTLPLPPPPPPPQSQQQQPQRDQTLPFIVEPPEPEEPPKPTIPLQRRGFVGLDATALSAGNNGGALLTDFVASIPLSRRALVEARIAMLATGRDNLIGSPTAGGRYLLHPTKLLWIDLGGHIGLPIATDRSPSTELYSLARGGWDTQTFLPDTLKLRAHSLFEIATEPMFLRFEFVPQLSVDTGSGSAVSDDPWRGRTDLYLQNAVELQSRGPVGGGFRLQGVLSPTQIADNQGSFILSTEPFFYIEKKLAFLRFGLLLPFAIGDSAPSSRGLNYCVRLTTGIRLDP